MDRWGLTAVLVLLVVVAGTERAMVTCEERFPRRDAPPGAAPLSQLGPPEEDPAWVIASPRKAAKAALGVAPESGLKPPAWAANAGSQLNSLAANGPGSAVITGERNLSAYRAADGRGLWRRAFPDAEAAQLEPTGRGVAVLTLTAGERRAQDAEPEEREPEDRTWRVATIARGEVSSCSELGSLASAGGVPRPALATDPGRGLVATVHSQANRSRVILRRQGGAEEAWEAEVGGEWNAVAVAGPAVILGNASRDPRNRSLVALNVSDGRPRWDVPQSEAARHAPTGVESPPGLGRARIAGLRTAGERLVGAGMRVTRDNGDGVLGRTLAADAASGRMLWSGASLQPLGPAPTVTVADGLLLGADDPTGPDAPIRAVDLRAGRLRWTSHLGPGKELGDLLRYGSRIYASGGEPAVVEAATGRARPLTSQTAARDVYWFSGGATIAAGRLILTTSEGLLFAFPLRP